MRAMYTVLTTAAVTSIVGTKVYQDQAEQDTPAPFIVWSRMVAPLTGLPHAPVADRETFTIDIMAANEAQRDALLLAVRDALEPVGVIGMIQSLGKDAETKIWRYTLDVDLYDPR